MVGGQDDQIFDGGSFVLNPSGKLMVQLRCLTKKFVMWIFVAPITVGKLLMVTKPMFPPTVEQDYRAMVESLRDYMGKTGFKKVLLGLSGGIGPRLWLVLLPTHWGQTTCAA